MSAALLSSVIPCLLNGDVIEKRRHGLFSILYTSRSFIHNVCVQYSVGVKCSFFHLLLFAV